MFRTTKIVFLIFLIVFPNLVNSKETIDSINTNQFENLVDENTENDIYPLSVVRQEKLRTYSQFIVIWRFISFAISILILYFILRTKLSSKIRDWSKIIPNEFFSMWMYLILFILLFDLLSLPIKIYREILIEQEFGFFNQSISSWIFGEVKYLFLTFIFGIFPFYFFYKFYEKFKKWWLHYTLASIPVIVTVVIISPILIMPIFNDYEPLKDNELKAEIQKLAERTNVIDADILQVNASEKSTRVNAFVDGLLNTKRIVLYDNLIENFDLDEIKFVVSHEIGHYKMNHVWEGVLLSFVIIGFALWLFHHIYPFIFNRYKDKFRFNSFHDYASFPVLMIYISLFLFVASPFINFVSRYQEHQADKFAVENSDVSKESAVVAFEKLSAFNLADPDPNPFIEFWFYSHPSLKKRIDFVKNYSHVPN